MKNKLLFILTGIILSGNAQTNTTGKKPFPFMGNFTLNYEVKKTGIPAVTKGNIICAFNGYDAAFIPSYAATLQDVTAAKLLININYNEMTMLTTIKTGKKSGILTQVPKQVLAIKITKPPVFTKTGFTKNILTYPCQEIMMTLGDTTKVDAWITNAIILPVNDAIQFTNLGFKNKSPLNQVNISALNATSLQTVITSKNGDVLTLTVTDINKLKPNHAFFNSNGFNILDARGLLMH